MSDDEIAKRYETFLSDVEAVQTEQIELLRVMIRAHGTRAVYVEG